MLPRTQAQARCCCHSGTLRRASLPKACDAHPPPRRSDTVSNVAMLCRSQGQPFRRNFTLKCVPRAAACPASGDGLRKPLGCKSHPSGVHPKRPVTRSAWLHALAKTVISVLAATVFAAGAFFTTGCFVGTTAAFLLAADDFFVGALLATTAIFVAGAAFTTFAATAFLSTVFLAATFGVLVFAEEAGALAASQSQYALVQRKVLRR